MKTGFLAVPACLAAAAEGAIRQTVSGASPLLAALASRLITNGALERVILAKRADAARRQELARDVLRDFTLQGHPASYHLWVTLDFPAAADAICTSLRRAGIDVAPAAIFCADNAAPNAFRLAFGQERDEETLRRALQEVARRCVSVGAGGSRRP